MPVRERLPYLPHASLRHKQSGYEPSDTESEDQDTPWHGRPLPHRTKTPDPVRPITPFQVSNANPSATASRISRRDGRNDKSPSKSIKNQNESSRNNYDTTSRTIQTSRSRSKSPYKPTIDSNSNVSPYRAVREESIYKNHGVGNVPSRKPNTKTPPKYRTSSVRRGHPQPREVSPVGVRNTSFHNRSTSAPRVTALEMKHDLDGGRISSQIPLPVTPTIRIKGSHGAYAGNPSHNKIDGVIGMNSVDSIAPGDIFFSYDCDAMKKRIEKKNSSLDDLKMVTEQSNSVGKSFRRINSLNELLEAPVSSRVLTRSDRSSSTVSLSISGIISNDSSKMNDSIGKLSKNFRKFAVERQRGQGDAWFSCVKRGPCRNSKSPESRAINESSFIEKAFVVEELRPFWADLHRPKSLSDFICHRQEAMHIKQLISPNIFPHVLFRGPLGSGKKSLCRGLLHDIFGDSSSKISHDLRQFHIQETKPVQVVVPLASSPHHVEIDLKTGAKYAIYALMALVKEIAANHALNREISDASFMAEYKVIVLYNVDKVEESLQHLIKWTMDCYMDTCKILICCEDDTSILDAVKSRCKLVTLKAPATHEIMEVLLHVAKKEKLELSVSFASKIASRSNQNMRGAIMALEACKAHNYPFVDEQPIPVGWEEILVELASEILADPSPKRLFFTRGKFQQILVDSVDPKIILQKLVEQFLKGIENGLKRELFYWHAYYGKRMPTGTSALLKLEEFVAKFMSIYRNRNRSQASPSPLV